MTPHLCIKDGYIDPKTGLRVPVQIGTAIMDGDGHEHLLLGFHVIEPGTRPVVTVGPLKGLTGDVQELPVSSFPLYEVRMLP